MKYALVLVNITGLGVKTFSYLIPEEMKQVIQIGQPVLVPFGKRGLVNAFVVGFSDYLPGDFTPGQSRLYPAMAKTSTACFPRRQTARPSTASRG